MIHNEDSRVKVPVLLHFLRLGYEYQSKSQALIDSRNNIFVEIFQKSLSNINRRNITDKEIQELLNEIALLTDNHKDKGESFFNRLINQTGLKLIDLKQPALNDFRVVSELRFQKEHGHFRPDITVLINGIPIAFVEVKKPNNINGIQAEFKRQQERVKEAEYTSFFNQFQVLGFTNNHEYNDAEQIKMSGSFYATPNAGDYSFNHFREEQEIAVSEYLNDTDIDYILKDNNLVPIKVTHEFQYNLKPESPANRFITSIFSKERLIFFIRYGIVYVNSMRDGLNKHIIRYPQFFALLSLKEKLEDGLKRGIIWHTQGSGKTSLAYFATNVLRDYYQEKGIITKFYFVVDRLDLLNQSTSEFIARGMSVSSINSKEEFAENIKSPRIVMNTSIAEKYKETINVVNIQKFSEEATVDGNIDKRIQRIYFLDEVHRGYKPKGTFLSNLLGVDYEGVFIGLTGTPILKKEYKSTDLFSGYIHKYYYNKSIADGYTLKIKKENISTRFKSEVRGLFDLKDDEKISFAQWELVGKQPVFVEKICHYIEEDFLIFRDEIYQDQTLGYMIVTSSSEQARMIQSWFKENSELKTALVLFDEEGNKKNQEEFRGVRNINRQGETESAFHGVVVYNMLLTGFDAPRLKRLYLLRRIREHSLLQTLARVNRPYKRMKYGYVVDFVDITEEYEETNRRYIEELREDIIDSDGNSEVDDLFVDVEQVKAQIRSLNNKLFIYMGNIENNLEAFRHQIELLDQSQLRDMRITLENYQECYNELRMARENVDNMPVEQVKEALKEVISRIRFKNDEERLSDPNADVEEINFENLVVEFLKTGELDLEFTTENDIIELVSRIRNEMYKNQDKDDKVYLELIQNFKQIMIDLKHAANSTEQVQIVMIRLRDIYKGIQKLNIDNQGIAAQYRGDDSCMRIHKKLKENYSDALDNSTIYAIMMLIINETDKLLGGIQPTMEVMTRQLMRPVRDAFKIHGIQLGKSQVLDIVRLFTDDRFR